MSFSSQPPYSQNDLALAPIVVEKWADTLEKRCRKGCAVACWRGDVTTLELQGGGRLGQPPVSLHDHLCSMVWQTQNRGTKSAKLATSWHVFVSLNITPCLLLFLSFIWSPLVRNTPIQRSSSSLNRALSASAAGALGSSC